MPLTDVAIRALKSEAKRYSRTDERGLVIEVFPTGGMLWHYRYRVNGKPERVTLVAQGQSPAAQKRLTRQGLGPEVTVAEFGERFFREIVSRDRKDITIPRRYFDKSIAPAGGSELVLPGRGSLTKQALCAQRDEQCAEGGAAGAGHPGVHDS